MCAIEISVVVPAKAARPIARDGLSFAQLHGAEEDRLPFSGPIRNPTMAAVANLVPALALETLQRLSLEEIANTSTTKLPIETPKEQSIVRHREHPADSKEKLVRARSRVVDDKPSA